MPNKHFCQGPNCHTYPTTDRFLKSRGVVRGRYAYAQMDQGPNQYGWQASDSDKFFCSTKCEGEWLCEHMESIEQARPIEFIRHRRESQGYHKETDDSGYRRYNTIERINGTDN